MTHRTPATPAAEGVSQPAPGPDNHDHTPQAPVHILIVDDHPLTCHGLAALLGASRAGDAHPRVVRSVHSAQEARAALGAPLSDAPALDAPDWVFLDIRLPDDPACTLFEALCASPWAARTVLISAAVPQPLVRQALGAGMRGFIPKSADPAMVLDGFDTVLRGGVYLPQELAQLVERSAPPAKGLSPRLREVLARVMRGAPNKVIARELGVSEYTVKEYMSSILAYHGMSNRLELVLKLKQADLDD